MKCSDRFQVYWNQKETVIWDTVMQKRVEKPIWNYLGGLEMLTKEEVICRATKEFGEQIGNIEIIGDKVLFTESDEDDLFVSEFEDVFDKDEYSSIRYNGSMDTIIVDLTPEKLDIDGVFKKIKTGYARCESLISLTKEKTKITIVVERWKNWGKASVIRMIGNEYHITEYENSDGDWEITISLEDEFDICNATTEDIRKKLSEKYEVHNVFYHENGTINIILDSDCTPYGVMNQLDLPPAIDMSFFKSSWGKTLGILNRYQINAVKKRNSE